MKNGFLLGAHHGMTIEDVDYVCDKIKEFYNMYKI
jgi:CDP-6-deoxy-D-xylo-4-hexulose-3-dehydrase